jgi:hypothetical protein
MGILIVLLLILALILLTVLPTYLRQRRGGPGAESWEPGETKAERQQRARNFDALDHGDFTGRRGR